MAYILLNKNFDFSNMYDLHKALHYSWSQIGTAQVILFIYKFTLSGCSVRSLQRSSHSRSFDGSLLKCMDTFKVMLIGQVTHFHSVWKYCRYHLVLHSSILEWDSIFNGLQLQTMTDNLVWKTSSLPPLTMCSH